MSVPIDPAVSHSRSLSEALASLPDPRHSKGMRHPLGALLSLTVVAMLSGAENPQQISRFAATHPELLAPLGFHPPKQGRLPERRGKIAPPSNDMIARVFQFAEAAPLNERLADWLARLLVRGDAAALDGKALRGQGNCVVSLFCARAGQALWQVEVGEKQNELSALLPLLDPMLDRLSKIRLFTGDAGFCHKKFARRIIAKRRDYLLQLKAPHNTDVHLAQDAFAQLTKRPPLAETVEKKGVRGGSKS